METLNPRALAVASLACFVAAIAMALAVDPAVPGPIDTSLANQIHAWALTNPAAVDIALMLQLLGSGLLSLLIIAVMVFLWARGHPGWAAWLGVCSLGGLLISQTVKNAVERTRPDWADPIETANGFAFPSGHAMAGIYGWVALGILALALADPPWDRILGVGLIAIGVLMGPSRWVLGVHWPTDVVEGWLLAAGWVLLVSAVALRLQRSDE